MARSGAKGPVGQLHEVGLDVADLGRTGRFWAAVLGLKGARRSGPYLNFEPLSNGLIFYLQKVPENKVAKNRMHIDIKVADLDVALARVEALGGKRLRLVDESGSTWITAADPEGNEFCLVR